jgi:hypothetical protein
MEMRRHGISAGMVLMLSVWVAFTVACWSQSDAQGTGYSYEFIKLMEQVQLMYLHPQGWNLRTMEHEYPGTLAAVVGHALRQQASHLGPYYHQDPDFINLQNEAFGYLAYVAYASGYVNEEGYRITEEDLKNIAYGHMRGEKDQDIYQFFNVRVGDMPSVLEVESERGYADLPGGPPSGIEFEEEHDGVTLLGIEAGAEPEEEPDPTEEAFRNFKPQSICGLWEGKLHYMVFTGLEDAIMRLKIWMENDIYYGAIVSCSDGNPMPFGCVLNDLCFEANYDNKLNILRGASFSGRRKSWQTDEDGNPTTWQWEGFSFWYSFSGKNLWLGVGQSFERVGR